MKLTGFCTMAALAVLTAVTVPRANATVEISLTNGASTVTITDGGAGDVCGAANCVTYSGAIGNYIVNVSTGISQDGANPFLDLNSVDLTAVSGAGQLTIETSDVGYVTPVPQWAFKVGGTSSLGGTVAFSAYGGNSDTQFDTSNQIGSTLTFTGSPYSGSTMSSSGVTANPYSLTIMAQLNGVTSGAASFDAALDAVPEPASVLLLGGILLFTGSRLRRKVQRSV